MYIHDESVGALKKDISAFMSKALKEPCNGEVLRAQVTCQSAQYLGLYPINYQTYSFNLSTYSLKPLPGLALRSCCTCTIKLCQLLLGAQ